MDKNEIKVNTFAWPDPNEEKNMSRHRHSGREKNSRGCLLAH